MIKTEHLSAGYNKKIILSDVNLNLKKGNVVTLIGPNGSGKSTLLKTLCAQIKAINGKVCIVDKDIDKYPNSFIAKQIALVTTERIRPELMSCRDVIATGRYPYTGKFGFLSDTDWAMVYTAVKITGCESIVDRQFNSISDGQRQRVMLARSICQDTDVIALDEPTSYLDMYYKIELLRNIYNLAHVHNKLILMSLHELDLVKSVSDFVVCVDGCKVCKTGTVDEVFADGFIQKLYGIKDDEFDCESGRMILKVK